MKNQIKELRVKIDGLAQLTKELKPISKYLGVGESESSKPFLFNSKEIEKAVDSLYLAKAWLGKMLGELGTETPYANDGKRKSVKDIELTADQSWYKKEELNHDMNFDLFREKNHIEKVDWLRQEIKKLFIPILNLQISDYNITIRYWNNCLTELEKSRFWLGFELERCKNEE